MEERELLLERLELAILRIREIPGEDFQGAELLPWKEYFTTVAKFLQLIEDTRQFLEQGKQATATLEELQQRNHALYEDILPERGIRSTGGISVYRDAQPDRIYLRRAAGRTGDPDGVVLRGVCGICI